MISIVTAVALSTAGCGSGGSSSQTPTPTPTPTSITTSGTASDGYISGATVCLDMNINNLCDTTEPSTVTDVNGSYSLTVSATDRANALVNAPLLLTGGTDIDTKTKLTGTLRAPFDTNATSVTTQITPLTTLVAIMVKNNIPVATAYKKVAIALNLTEEEVKADPVKLAKDNNNTKVIQVSMSIHRIISTMAKTADINNSDIYNSLADAISTVADSNTSTKSIATIVTTASNESNSKLPEKAKKAAKVASIIETTISDAIANQGSIQDAALVSDEVVSGIQTEVKTAIDNNDTIDDNFITNVENNASNTLSNVNPIKSAVKNIVTTYLSIPSSVPTSEVDADITTIASAFSTSSDVTVEAILDKQDSFSSVNSSLFSDLATAYTKQQIKLYVEKNNQHIADTEINAIEKLGINYKNLKTISLQDFSNKIYASGDAHLMSLALKLSPPASTKDDITKAKSLFNSVRTQINQVDTFTNNESAKINTALNSISVNTTFITIAFNNMNNMIHTAMDTNRTTLSRTVSGGNRKITVTSANTANDVVWNYNIQDTNVTTPWTGSITYTNVDPNNFKPSSFSPLTATFNGTMPMDFYAATIPTGKTNSQSVDATIKITKTGGGASLNVNAVITNNGDSIRIKDANLIATYTTNSSKQEPTIQYVELQNLYTNGTAGNYTLDGKLDVKSYAINKIGASKGFDPKTTRYSFGIVADCTNNFATAGNGYNYGEVLNTSLVTYNGIPVSQYSRNYFSWFDLTSKPTNINQITSYTNLKCANQNDELVLHSFYTNSRTEDDFQNNGHYPSEITFDGKLADKLTSEYLNAKIDAKWTNIVDANLSDKNYQANLNVALTGELSMSNSKPLNISVNYENNSTSKRVAVIYVDNNISVHADSIFSNDNTKPLIVNLSSTSGIKAKIIRKVDGSIDYTNSTLTNTAGKTVGTFEDRKGVPVVKFSDGNFVSLP